MRGRRARRAACSDWHVRVTASACLYIDCVPALPGAPVARELVAAAALRDRGGGRGLDPVTVPRQREAAAEAGGQANEERSE
eukprot:1272313-Pyramimonas_sp.AAC.1